ncbi:hypothetical protein [Chitinophaga caseinilytica]|uniref:hypothetical protein n=1 Tax=Chitinophaga caseinilytica TaxID=2267521 RepID=UPI003C2CE1F6
MNVTSDPGEESSAYYEAEALLIALLGDDPDMLESVIKAGGDVNTAFEEGQTPLHILIESAIDGMMQDDLVAPGPETLKMIELLLGNGAELSRLNDAGETPLDILNVYAAGSKESFELLKDIFRGLIPDIDDRITYISGSSV